MISVQTFNKIISWLVLAGQIFLVVGFIYYLIFRKEKKNVLIKFIGQRGMLFAFIVALVATAGSLFYSEIAKFTPCSLCWLQRIFMYPQVALLGLALYKKDFKIIPYSLFIAGIGTLISIYHNYIYYKSLWFAAPVTSCSPTGESCVKLFVLEMGYITIPLMALTAFLMIIFLLFLQKEVNKQS